jgi:hypothetical protein
MTIPLKTDLKQMAIKRAKPSFLKKGNLAQKPRFCKDKAEKGKQETILNKFPKLRVASSSLVSRSF